ncbi:disease resistance protein RPV1-like isoform X2 [Cryptomeria japonica]|uniref:disease resistance protein RPV1-like isoform X2 n=1 Tax=Cryptomeria japonica TaxID=3369 RepID=UPI0027DAB148|nr:disease resistance protein RPV1-like isoform X2 [Cryptomeria japonica]
MLVSEQHLISLTFGMGSFWSLCSASFWSFSWPCCCPKKASPPTPPPLSQLPPAQSPPAQPPLPPDQSPPPLPPSPLPSPAQQSGQMSPVVLVPSSQMSTEENSFSLFQTINNATDVDYLIQLIDEFSDRSKQEEAVEESTSLETLSDTLKDRAKSVWSSFIQSGCEFLEFVNKHIQLTKGDEGTREAVAQILQKVEKAHRMAGGLALVVFLLDQIDQISENRSECIQLVRQMAKLAGHIRKLKYDMPQEEDILNEAVLLVVEGSIMCASQLRSRTLFRCMKASVNYESLGAVQLKINQLYQDLTFRAVKDIQQQQSVTFPPWKPIYPYHAVRIEEQKKQVKKLLDMETENNSSLAVVIYGFGGIGKTTLATAVIAELDLANYNYSGVQMKEDRPSNYIKCMQEQILKDAFPAYTYDRNVTLRNSAEGRDHLTSAFQAQGNKPVFLFIDNALRTEDLQELFPKRLSGLPKRSRIVLTTRNLGVTDMLKDAGLTRREHIVDTLPDQEAIEILLKDDLHNTINRDTDDMRKILRICAGIPLVLEIVGSRLSKQNFMVERCTQIFEALERGKDVIEENLSKRLFTNVYNELETSTQEAFLDICCFFASWSRHDVECIVGAEEVTHLEEAALFKTSDKGKLVVLDIFRAKGMSMSESKRITDIQSWVDVVRENQRLDQIRGLWLERDETDAVYELHENHILSMKKSLRVLALGNKINVSPSGRKTPKFKELRFLRLGGDISGLWPVNLECLERLAVFHGPVFKDGVTLYRLPKRLRVMKATAHSQESANLQESKPANVIQNSSLEELDLKEMRTLQILPKRLDHLTGLKVLILDEWDKMHELSEQVCELRSLCKLSISGGNSLKNLPKLFGQLSCLEELILTSCKQLDVLPSTFGDLSSLKHLNLAECVNIKELPSSFGRLTSLEVLNLESCWKLEALPSSFGQLHRLKKLSLQSNDLEELPSSFGELTALAELRCNCLELKQLPDSFGQLISLTHLDLSSCMKLKSLPSSVGELRSLKYFNLSSCSKLEELPPNIDDLQCLTQLELKLCNSLKESPIFSFLRERNQGLTIWLPDQLKDKESFSSNQRSQ